MHIPGLYFSSNTEKTHFMILFLNINITWYQNIYFFNQAKYFKSVLCVVPNSLALHLIICLLLFLDILRTSCLSDVFLLCRWPNGSAIMPGCVSFFPIIRCAPCSFSSRSSILRQSGSWHIVFIGDWVLNEDCNVNLGFVSMREAEHRRHTHYNNTGH